MVMRKIVTSGWPFSYFGKVFPSQLVVDFARVTTLTELVSLAQTEQVINNTKHIALKNFFIFKQVLLIFKFKF
jgi:hypothetical protein